MSTLRIKTAPTTEPVTLAEVRAMLGITDVTDTTRDAVISRRINCARSVAEDYCNRALITQTWTLYADKFENIFDLKANLQSVSSVKYFDSNGVQQTLAADQYRVDAVNARLYPAFGVSWPTARCMVNSIEIDHVAGFGAASDVPQRIKEAIMWAVAHWENNQTPIEASISIKTLPYAIPQLLSPFVDFRNSI